MRNGKYQNGGSKRILVLALALVLLLGCGIGGTIAWLTANSGTVTNTFTVGDINITLQEYPFKVENGVTSTSELDKNATPVQTINTYKVVPGGSQPKEPFVTVKANSENCYVYVCVENNLTINNTIVVTYDINTTDWVQVATKTDATTGAVTTLYRYKDVVAMSNEDQKKTVFTAVSYSDTILKDAADKTNISQLIDKTIVLNAFAHQSDNTNQNTADTAAKAQFNFS